MTSLDRLVQVDPAGIKAVLVEELGRALGRG